jgi:hypothetical protein
LLIQTTGLEDYAPGGNARVKVLVIGGPGAGKTRWASYFPDPLYADCEGGLASVADRRVPYATVNNSDDMLDFLAYLKQECQQPAAQRKYQTVVIDTLDAFQRKVKNEWMEKEKKQVFTGWDAWGYMNSKMQLLMTRLLNLDLNVVVLVHFKDKTTEDDNTGKRTHSTQLLLQGEISETAFNDFDLVAFMGTYFAAVDGERVQCRGLKFKPTPEFPFLKDRLHVVPDWLEVNFDPGDYTRLFDAIQARVEDMPAGEVVGEIGPAIPENVVAPGQAGTGAMQLANGISLPLTNLDKPTLMKMCREQGISKTTDGAAIRGNTLKSELIAALEAAQREQVAVPAPAERPQRAEPQPAPAETAEPAPSEPVAAEAPPEAPPEAPVAKTANPRRVRKTEVGDVDTTTGEVLEKKPEWEQELGEDKATPVTPEPAPAAETAKPQQVCEDCGKDLEGENPDFVKLSYIKFRKRLCAADYQKRKNGAR